ncbi:uncharacterized protein LOC112570464 [Pomacea canaliculata]|uniref:uncharacterized protein LOC112570464 n=1 Tax=Pomacea canaliculata TaxID=400727 RepID=UPI000D7368EB|nr:uncharacterized protein LOC112570464 [Pomacea canaliculata]
MAIILLVTFTVMQLLCCVYIIKYKITTVEEVGIGDKIFILSLNELYIRYPFFNIIENVVLSLISLLNFIVVFLATVITVVRLRSAMAWRKSTASSYLMTQAVVIKMLVAVSSIYILCTAPTIILALMRFTIPEFREDGRYSNLFLITHYIFTLPLMLHLSISFFIYSNMSSRFRLELQTLCLCLKPVKPSKIVLVPNGSGSIDEDAGGSVIHLHHVYSSCYHPGTSEIHCPRVP